MAEDHSLGSTRSASSPARRSRRPAQSCDPCRRRKVRCDLKSPCSACQVSRNSVTCTYQGNQQQPSLALEDRGSEGNTAQQQVPRSLSIAPNNIDHPAKRQRTTNESERIRSVERRVHQLEHSVVPEVDPLPHSLSSGSNNHLTLLALSDRLQHVEQRLAELSQARPTPSAVTGNQSLTIPSVIPRLRHNQKKVKLFPSSHWLHTAEKFRVSHVGDSDVELTFVDTKAELADSVNEIRNLRLTMKNEQAPQMDDPVPPLLSTMPARSICDRLVNHYMRTFELIYRCFHIPTFWAEYEQYFSQPQLVVTNFAIKLGLVLAIGSVFSNDDDDKVLQRSRRTWIQAAQYWMVGPSEKTTNNLDGIQIFCLLLVSRQITLVGRSPWLSESGLLRVAMAMGLHRDPQLFSLSPFQASIRRRLWTTVLELVIHGSMDCSIPLLLSSNDFDDHMPLNVSDADLDPASKQSPSPQPLTSYTESSIQILMRQSLPVRLEVVRAVQNERLEHSYEMAIELATKLQAVCRTLASYCRSHWSQFLSMHHAFLDMQIRRYILVLHRPFMLQAQNDPCFYFSRRVCQESAMIIATYAERLRLPADPLDDLSKLMVMSTGSFRGPLSLDIISVLGLEVVSQLEETGSNPSSALIGLNHTLVLDPLAELACSQRAPIIRLLEHINEQLLQIVKLGHPTLKRYIFLAGILSQIYAMERGQPILSAVLNTAKDTLKECYDVLQSYRAANSPREVPQDVIDNGLLGGLDFGAMDSNFLDFSAFFVPTVR